MEKCQGEVQKSEGARWQEDFACEFSKYVSVIGQCGRERCQNAPQMEWWGHDLFQKLSKL